MHFHGLILNIDLMIEFYIVSYILIFFLLAKKIVWGVDQTWKLVKLKKS